MRIKVCLVGDRGVGKTSLIRRFAANQYAPDEKGTLGAHMHTVDVEIPLDSEQVAKVKVDLFDFMGEHALRDNFRDAIFYGAHGVLAVCDLARPETMRSLVDWIQAVSSVAGRVPAVVAFNKVDLRDQVAIGPTEMRALLQRIPGAHAQMTSALTGQGVEPAFNKVILASVEGILGGEKAANEREDLRYDILMAIAHRETTGRTKGEIIGAFKSWDPKVVMEELDNLVQLKLVSAVEYTPATFVNTQSIPVNSHFAITPEGQKVASGPRPKGLVVHDT